MHISTLVKEGMAKRKKQGAVFGNPRIKETAIPAGLAVRKEKAKKLRASLEKSILKLTEGKVNISFRQMAEILNKEGITTWQGRQWTGPNLFRALGQKNPTRPHKVEIQ